MSNEENGIFMTYLKKALDKRNITVIDMLERFKRYSKREIPSIASDQMPVMFSSLAEALSLYDPVDRENIGETIKLLYLEITLLDYYTVF